MAPKTDLTCHHTVTVPSGDMFKRHLHDTYEILYFIRGEVDYFIEGTVYRLQKNDLLLIPPRTFHYALPRSDAVYERFVIHFPTERIRAGEEGFPGHGNCVYSIPQDHVIHALYGGWERYEGVFSKEELRRYVEALIDALPVLLRHFPVKPMQEKTHAHPTLLAILRYIDEHPWQRITASTLASRFFVSTSWIIHTFRRELGISLMQYVAKKRILYMQSCIRAGESPTEVAKRCEYESYVTFYRQYKRILGKTPREDGR